MHAHLGRRFLPVVGLVTAGLLTGSLLTPAHADDDPSPSLPADPTSKTILPSASSEEASEALDQVQALLDPESADAPTTADPADPATTEDDGRDLTMALRNLHARMSELSRTDRAAAARVTDRPWTNRFDDFGKVRVHWRSGAQTSWVDHVGSVSRAVLAKYAAAGYRAPKSDGTVGGGSGLVDIYVVPLERGLYGYCDTSSSFPRNGPYDVPAFCVFNSDFSWAPHGTALQNLQVTAAHELFHAVQFAYDYLEDQWFMEATATWAEDELYDSINDNRQYLVASPLKQPRQPLDQFSQTSLRQYGEWIFFRYLSERFRASQAGLPIIIRQMWRRADASRGAPDNYSIKAVAKELVSHKTSLRATFARFAEANRHPGRSYSEGRAYPRARPTRGWTLTRAKPDTHPQHARINHLAAVPLRLRPGAAWRKLKISLDLPNISRGSAATVTVYRKNGSIATKGIHLGRRGVGHATVRFDRRTVKYVEVTLVNAGARYKQCWTGPRGSVAYSCSGVPRDDRLVFNYRMRAVR